MKNVSKRICVSGNQLSPNIAAEVLAEHGIKATKANIAKLVEHTIDKDGNAYLKRSELAAGAAKLAKALQGGGPNLKPDQPIARVIAAPPQSLSRYGLSLEDTDGNRSVDMLRIIALPLRDQKARDPRVRAMAGAPKSRAVSEEIGHDRRGNITLQFRGADGELASFQKGKWVTTSFREALAGRPNAKEELARLRAAGYDLNAQRDLLAVTVKGEAQPFVFGLRGPQDKKAPAADDAGGGRAFMPQLPGFGIDKRDYGFVSICNDVQVEPWGEGSIITVKKPVIYVYPEKKTAVRVTVRPNGQFSAQYPATTEGTWNMIATPDGMLFDPKTEKRYSYLFWEALNPGQLELDPARSTRVRAEDAEQFLDDSARKFGLNDRERTDFVSYWIPALLRNPVSLVQFLDAGECDRYAKLEVEPKPDAELRLFMIFRRAQAGENAGSPTMPELRRGKYTVVEWGGANLDE